MIGQGTVEELQLTEAGSADAGLRRRRARSYWSESWERLRSNRNEQASTQ